MKMIIRKKGGPGSGFAGHAGIPGHQGGSQAEEGRKSPHAEQENIDRGALADIKAIIDESSLNASIAPIYPTIRVAANPRSAGIPNKFVDEPNPQFPNEFKGIPSHGVYKIMDPASYSRFMDGLMGLGYTSEGRDGNIETYGRGGTDWMVSLLQRPGKNVRYIRVYRRES